MITIDPRGAAAIDTNIKGMHITAAIGTGGFKLGLFYRGTALDIVRKKSSTKVAIEVHDDTVKSIVKAAARKVSR